MLFRSAHEDCIRARLADHGGGKGVPGGQDDDGSRGLLAQKQITGALSQGVTRSGNWAGVDGVKIQMARIHAAETPKPGQDRKVAAIRDAFGRRGLRVTLMNRGGPGDSPGKVESSLHAPEWWALPELASRPMRFCVPDDKHHRFQSQ